MTERPSSSENTPARPGGADLAGEVDARVRRKLRARRRERTGVWFGLGMMGLIGWSVVVPTLLGAALGSWLDAQGPGQHRWTLALLVAGLVLGCVNAWHWVAKEDRAMRQDDKDSDDAPR